MYKSKLYQDDPRSDSNTPLADSPCVYAAKNQWSKDRPGSLVVCCSDGRLQESIDEFLLSYLGIVDYDRLYTPGGPGALSNVGCEFIRANQYRTELQFLLHAHSFQQVVLIFHGTASGGPAHATCAHYIRLMHGGDRALVARRQHDDMNDVKRFLRDVAPSLLVRAFRAEVGEDLCARFVDLAPIEPDAAIDNRPTRPPLLTSLPDTAHMTA